MSEGSQPYTGLLSLDGAPVLERGAHTISWLGKSPEILHVKVRRKASGNLGVLLKGPHTDSHSKALTLSSGKGAVAQEVAEIYRVTELCGFRARTRGKAITFPVLSTTPRKLAGRRHLSCVESSPDTAKSELSLA